MIKNKIKKSKFCLFVLDYIIVKERVQKIFYISFSLKSKETIFINLKNFEITYERKNIYSLLKK